MAHPLAVEYGEYIEPKIITEEIFDMIRPKVPGFITLEDLLASGYGHTVCAILTDAHEFITYENRFS